MKIITAALFAFLSSSAYGEDLHFLTEDYPPFSYTEGSELKGISVDQVRAIMDDIGVGFTLEMQPWARAFSLAETTRDTCVFTTGLLPERKAKFKWVQPLVLDIMIMVRKAGQPFAPKTLDEAKGFIIGVHRDDSAETYAKQQGFPQLDSAPSLEVSLKKLLSDRVQLVIMTKTTYENLRQTGSLSKPSSIWKAHGPASPATFKFRTRL
ncbi:transporter substrate-binding domain-containing protein [Rhizobium sp. 32-5/1]|uniref:substrate-binding periplasmic protein n=1 Tax=Rhizobium sp. 32-5/1 TaxID=3019602 RepID=UPI00240E7201|nr:transporter substrate-binding domain-containing protein [Rhizobium sp. 32-5/1]WEZ82935.1 transporter substrate-binding domain-containing protein [Rhizobium sp. 32-5/1]